MNSDNSKHLANPGLIGQLQSAVNLEQKRFSNATKASLFLNNLDHQQTIDHLKAIADITKDQSQTALDQVEELKKVNETLEKQIATALSDSKSAKKEAMFAKIATVISILISLIALFT